MKIPEQHRLTEKTCEKYGITYIPQLCGVPGNIAGMYAIVYPGNDEKIICFASNGMDWDHVSVSVLNKHASPTWEQMCYVKSHFWDDEETVVQLHPPRSQWVNNHPYCLHLWKYQKEETPLPKMEMVGLRLANTSINQTTYR
jgi:hypothetical protein